MSSGSPRARIDQFFASRKRKSQPSKDEILERSSKSPADGSPGAKGTLDTFLVKSPDAAPAAARAGAVAPSRHEPVKRNLTSEINLASDAAPKPLFSLRDHCGVKSTATVGTSDSVEGLGSEASGGNAELKRFATDFLSLYCSELLAAVNVPVERELKGHKRNGSPSLLVACDTTCTKKQCILDHSESATDIGKNCSSKCFPEPMQEEHNESVVKVFRESDGAGAAFPSLRKCSNTPISSLSKTGVSMLGSSINDLGVGQTPKSVSRSSMFSPGDEFWNEAIQVADGLYAPVGNLHGSQKLLKERSAHVTPQGAENISRSDGNELDAQDLVSNGCVKAVAKLVEETKPAIVQHHKVSPLPVKHFDFSHEENNGVENNTRNCFVEKAEAISNAGSQVARVADGSSVNDKRLQTSSILVHYGTQKNRETSNQKHACHNLSSSSEKSAQMSERASYLVSNEGKSGLLTQKKFITIMQNDKGLSVDRPPTGSYVSNAENMFKSRSNVGASCKEASTPSSSVPSKDLQLSSWLPAEVCNIYMKKGISKLYPWQVDCLLVDGVLEKRNLVYCASTSAGKSFVAEILMLRRVISTGKMALLVLPYVSICAEKAEHLELLLEPLGKHVRSFYGNQGGGSLPKDTSVAVCTIEKANSLVNRLLEEGRLSEVGIIVIDELHMVADQHRGYLLELMLTKLRYAAGEGNSDSCSGESSGSSSGKSDPAHGLQIVGMSATMPNVAAVADWLQAALYQTDFRPVPLEEFLKVGSNIFDKKMDVVRTIPKTADLGGKDPDHIVQLCNEVVQEGHSVLMFCSSRKGCESTARHLSRFLKKFSVEIRGADCEYNDASSAVEALRRCPAGLDPILEETLPAGIAYHHAGLTVEEREIIETCYRKGIVRVLTATSTLAAGVNLPARRVIFRQPRIGRDFIDGTRYRQMAGRAGRTGIDTKGESILICKPDEVKRVASILNDSCPPLQSCLSEDKNGMTHAILEVVAGGIVQTASDIHRYVRCTLLNSTQPFQDVVNSAQDSLRWLCRNKFLEWNEDTRLYSTTPLGRAAFGSSLNPEESLVVLDDILRAREGFVLATDLHLVYLVTPINVEVEPDWELYYERFMELPTLDQSVGNRVGVVEPFLMRMAHGAPMLGRNRSWGKKNGLPDKFKKWNAVNDKSLLSDEQILRVSRRFYVSLMLSRLVQEVPVADVCEAFKVARGMVQALQENAGRFASMLSVFCERLGWHDLEGLLAKFQNRVSFGVRAEIVELTNIPYVKGSRARALYKAGLRTPIAIAEASVSEIAKALFESSSWAGQEGLALRRMQMGVAKKIKNGARKIVLDQAEEARVAAFSAFKSLGVHIPQFSPPLLPTVAEDSFPQGGSMASSGEHARSSFDATSIEHPELVSGPPQNGRIMGSDISSLDVGGEKLAKITNNTAATMVEVRSAGQTRSDCNTANIRLLDGTSAEYSSPIKQTTATKASEASDYPELSAGYATNVTDVKIVPAKKEADHLGGNKLKYSNDHLSGKGPTNASNFPGGFDSFLEQWNAEKEFYFDVHFSKQSELHSPFLFEVFGLAICWENSPVYYVNFSKDLMSSGKQNIRNVSPRNSADDMSQSRGTNEMWVVAKSRWSRIANIMGQRCVRKFTWNLKIQIQALKFPRISIQKVGRLSAEQKNLIGIEYLDGSFILLPSIPMHGGIDICLVTWMLWPDEESKSTPNLEKVVKKRLSSEAAAAANRDGRWRNQMHKAAHDGCCRRVAQTRALASVLWKVLVSEHLVEVLTRIENPLVEVLADMELSGIGVDMEACLRARHILVRKLKELEKDAHSLAGMPFSLNSAAEIANILYTWLKLPIPTRKGKLHPSTDKHSLDLLRGQHPIISVIKEHRTLAKLLNSTLGSICSRARLCMKSQKYTIRGHWLQTSTATGRLSMEEPNLQCVEHLVVFTTNQSDNGSSSSDTNHHQINARDFFIPTEDNWLFLTADYSQIELRLMAHFSKDSSLIELLSKRNGDCFTMIAARWTNMPESSISSLERDQTKRLVYGILYGMGVNTLAEQLECSSEEAKEKIQSFRTSFPGVSAWLQETVASCRHKGYVETLMGRKRFLSKIKFGNSKEKAKAQRQAVNSICQGSAADIIKIAMIQLHNAIVEGKSVPTPNIGLATNLLMLKGHCRIILQVHDELVLEVDPSFIREAGKLLQMSMECAVSLLVPLHVKLKVGKRWGSLESFQPEC